MCSAGHADDLCLLQLFNIFICKSLWYLFTFTDIFWL